MVAREGKREENRRRLMDSARAVFFEDGFERANLDEIARRAGLAKGTIYRYFDSKAELYVEVLVANAEVFVQRLRATVDPALGPEDQIRRTGNFYFRHFRENPEYFRIFWALENRQLIGGVHDRVVEAVTDIWKRCLQILSDEI